LFHQTKSNHSNKSAAAKAQAESVFIANPKKNKPEDFDTHLHRENEERRIEQAIECQKRQRLERDATLANPPIKQHKQRGRPSKQRIPEAV